MPTCDGCCASRTPEAGLHRLPSVTPKASADNYPYREQSCDHSAARMMFHRDCDQGGQHTVRG